LGQLRIGSNASGPAYGKKFKKEGVLGVFLNMNTGVLAFSLNGEYMGVACKDSKLTKGPIFPAVALLHCAGCKIRSGLPVPPFFKD
jgi:E3 ubiquitin-protein ligase NRDP1